MKNTKRKGFTIVELVIVIAVIAILAAVLIPTFASLVKKANQSADIQAVRQMNTALAIYSAEESPEDLIDAINALDKQNINLDNYTPLTSGTQFYWVKSENRIVYAELNENGTCGSFLYPEEATNWEYKAGDWFVLDGTIKRETIDYSTAVDSNGTLNISTAGQFAQLAEDYVNGQASSVTKIVLTDDIDLSGAQATFGKISSDLEIDGNNKTIYGLRASKNVLSGYVYGNQKNYGYGLFGTIDSRKTVTIKNVKFVGANVGDVASQNSGNVGILAGTVNGTLKIDSVTFENCAVTGHQRVGAMVGNVADTGKVNVTGDVKFENVTVRGYANTAKLIGSIGKNGSVTVSSEVTLSGDGVTVEEFVEAHDANIASLKRNGRTWAEFEYNGDKFCAWYKNGDKEVGGTPLWTDALAWKKQQSSSVGEYTFEGNTYSIISQSISAFQD